MSRKAVNHETERFSFKRFLAWFLNLMKRSFLCILLLLIPGPAFSDDSPVVIAVIHDSADVPAGKEVISEAYRRIGVPVEFRGYSAAEALSLSGKGKVDAELQRIDGVSNNYPELVQVPIPVNIIQGAVFSKRYRFPIMGWHSLRPYRIGIVRGILFAEQQTAGLDRLVVDSYEALIEALQNDEIDVAVIPRIGGLAAIGSLHARGIREMDGVLETLFLYHYVHESRSDLVDRLTPVLKAMLLRGEIRQFREQELARIRDLL
jgi:ABC-type amino acid transport substrate-binding protein